MKQNKSIRRDLGDLILNTSLVYLGLSAISSIGEKSFYEGLTDKRNLLFGIYFGLGYGAFKLGRIHARYFIDKFRNK